MATHRKRRRAAFQIPGVATYDLGDGTWRLQWKDRLDDGTRPARTWQRSGLSDLELNELAIAIRRSVDETGTFDKASWAARHAIPAALIDGVAEFLQAKEADGSFSKRTAQTYKSYLVRCLDHIHAITSTPADKTIPVSVLDLTLFDAIRQRDRKAEISDTVAYGAPRTLLACWCWMADRPKAYPGVPTPPHDKTSYLPKTARYSRTTAPSLAHVDAMLRHLPDTTTESTRILAVFLRYTGLRLSSILAIRADEDIDRENRTLFTRKDKNHAYRTVPLATGLMAEVSDWLDSHPSGPLFPNGRYGGERTPEQPMVSPTASYKMGWNVATRAGLVPFHVWRPRQRRNARPAHGLRAAFDADLIGRKVDASVVDFLVGRNEGSENRTRAIHYGGDILTEARAAVDALDPIDWTGPAAPRESGKILNFLGA